MRFPGPYRQYWKILNINNELCVNCSFGNYLVVMMPPLPPRFSVLLEFSLTFAPRIASHRILTCKNQYWLSFLVSASGRQIINFFYYQAPRPVLLGPDHHWLPSYYVFALFYWLMVFSWELRGYCHSFDNYFYIDFHWQIINLMGNNYYLQKVPFGDCCVHYHW